jgi:hypothetical protein
VGSPQPAHKNQLQQSEIEQRSTSGDVGQNGKEYKVNKEVGCKSKSEDDDLSVAHVELKILPSRFRHYDINFVLKSGNLNNSSHRV